MLPDKISVPAPLAVTVLGPLTLLLIIPEMASDLPLLTPTDRLSFKATAVWMEFEVPPVTVISAPKPLSSRVRVLAAFVMAKELALVMLITPTVSLASRLTVRKAVLTPKFALSFATLGGIVPFTPVQLPASDQLPSLFSVQVPMLTEEVMVKVTQPPLVPNA